MSQANTSQGFNFNDLVPNDYQVTVDTRAEADAKTKHLDAFLHREVGRVPGDGLEKIDRLKGVLSFYSQNTGEITGLQIPFLSEYVTQKPRIDGRYDPEIGVHQSLDSLIESHVGYKARTSIIPGATKSFRDHTAAIAAYKADTATRTIGASRRDEQAHHISERRQMRRVDKVEFERRRKVPSRPDEQALSSRGGISQDTADASRALISCLPKEYQGTIFDLYDGVLPSEKYAEAVETISAIKDEKSLLGGIFKLRVGRFRRTSANNLFTKLDQNLMKPETQAHSQVSRVTPSQGYDAAGNTNPTEQTAGERSGHSYYL